MSFNNTYNVYQNSCIIANRSLISTGSFGPCYILAGHDITTNITFLAHLTDCTNLNMISEIFKKLGEAGAAKEFLNLRLLGGWANHPESNKWGNKILEVLKKEDVLQGLNTDHFQTKTMEATMNSKTHFYGFSIDTNNGKIKFFKKISKTLTDRQVKKNHQLIKKLLGNDLVFRDITNCESIVKISQILMRRPDISIHIQTFVENDSVTTEK